MYTWVPRPIANGHRPGRGQPDRLALGPPIAASFGVVKSSGVVGVDEKYVLVPKNDKPAGKMRRWMYVYLAADVWTYDLLHIALYPQQRPG